MSGRFSHYVCELALRQLREEGKRQSDELLPVYEELVERGVVHRHDEEITVYEIKFNAVFLDANDEPVANVNDVLPNVRLKSGYKYTYYAPLS